MDLLFRHTQEKTDKGNSKSLCDLKLYSDKTTIIYDSLYDFEYSRYGDRRHVLFQHHISINTSNGDITTTYSIKNDNLTTDKSFKNKVTTKRNDFNLIFDSCENGFFRGEKRVGYWGVKFHRAQDAIISQLLDLLKPKFNLEFYKIKDYSKDIRVNRLYDLLVDFHLDAKGIKSHNGIYYDIQYNYPKKKWLEKNEYKFLPAILDSYGIKSKYLVSELNKESSKPIHIQSLNYICKLFGTNHIDYLKQFNWEQHCYDLPPNKKIHELKNDSEKTCMVKTITNWETETLKSDSLVYSLNKLLSIRDLLESRGVELKYKAKNDNEFENHMEMWSGIKLHFARGYKVKYDLPEEFLTIAQQDIIVDDKLFKPVVLVTEEDYRIEGYNMKNCMAKQFLHGAIYVFVSMSHKRKKINLQYKKGKLIQSYGKANTAVDENLFQKAIDILTERMEKHLNFEWKKEKYDYLTH